MSSENKARKRFYELIIKPSCKFIIEHIITLRLWSFQSLLVSKSQCIRITKQGRRELRKVLVEAAWIAVNSHPYWKAQFERLTRRKPRNKAIVAAARKLLIAVWHVLSEQVSDKNAIPEMVAFKLMIWSWKLNEQEREGSSSRQFVRYHLIRLKLGEDLPYLITGKGTKRPIASPQEVLALRPELAAAG